ncbi:hypothetical protein [Mycolicibacterium goodii]|uniref:hypothetical protein n=1 Tax=Mycolicibacterium goodii TaxID=134601 RepID=UPI001BDC840F|nr:hypothetical protein [Mycolicibacterium goodii]MBU8830855.1 hypothetical protein [Mycolicibacterium goodii]
MTETTLRCIAGPWCRAAETINGERHGVITGQANTLCEHCETHIAKCCRELPTDYNELSDALGDRHASSTEFVRTSSTPAIPISTAKEALMREIVDILERAAEVVSAALGAEQPDGRRNLPKVRNLDGEFIDPEAGSIAANSADHIRPDAVQRMRACTAIIEPNITTLATAPEQDAMVWARPKRCPLHTVTVTAAEQELKNARTPSDIDAAETHLRAARHAAAHCDDCGAWDPWGQAAHIITTTGLDIAKAIVDVHNRTRAELGKTRLRHKYELPCPRCGSKVGRDDGTTIISCDNEACRASWTEREFKFLQGLIIEGQETEILKWLLSEAYTRLDRLQQGIDRLAGDQLLEQPRSGIFVLDGVAEVLTGHLRPAERKIASDKAEAAARQIEEDNWSWRNETPYKPPKRRTKPRKPYEGPKIADSSRSTLNEDPNYDPGHARRAAARKCADCNMIHRGDCVA